MKIIKKTKSYCNFCLKEIPAQIVEIEKKIKIQKRCDLHGLQIATHIWDNIQDYLFFQNLIDINYHPSSLLIELTSKCNLYCPLCFVKAGDYSDKDLNLKKIKKIEISKFDTIRLSGGEPTLRKDLFEIICYFKSKKKRVVLLTNGLKLSKESYVKKLKESKVDRVILQFDTFKESISQILRGKKLVKIKLKALNNLKKYNIITSLFVVLAKKRNLKELSDFKEFIIKNKGYIKIIYFTTPIPLGRYKKNTLLDISYVLKNLEQTMSLKRKDCYIITKFLFNISRLIKKKWLSKCALINICFISKDKLIPINRIFNLDRLNKILNLKKSHKYPSIIKVYLWICLIVNELILNFFVNRNYRILVLQILKNISNYFLHKKPINPFITFFIGSHQGLKNIDLEFSINCYKRTYSKEESTLKESCCSYYSKKESIF